MTPPSLITQKFEQRAPAHQNAVDIFGGELATDLVDMNQTG
jgi:hypothetical protein